MDLQNLPHAVTVPRPDNSDGERPAYSSRSTRCAREGPGANWVIAEGPLGVIAEAIACLPTERRNEFTIGFAFPAG